MGVMKKSFYMGVVFSILSISLSFAGGHTEGGGSLVKLPNNEIGLADPFLKRDGNRAELSEELKSYLRHIKELLKRYGVSSEKFWDEEVFGSVIYLYLTDEEFDRANCTDPMEVKTEEGAQVYNFACTKGHVTRIKQSAFEDKNISLKVQAMGLIHERLHAFTNNQEDHYILSEFISTVLMMLTLQNDQSVKEKRRPLTTEEMNAIARLRDTAKLLGFEVADYKYLIVQNGGGIIVDHENKVELSSTAFLGIGSKVDLFEEVISIGEEVEIINSIIGQHDSFNRHDISRRIGKKTKIQDSFIFFDPLGDIGEANEIKGADIRNSSLCSGNTISLSTIEISKIGSENKIEESQVDSSLIGSQNIIENSVLSKSKIGQETVGVNNHITDSKLDIVILESHNMIMNSELKRLSMGSKNEFNNSKFMANFFP